MEALENCDDSEINDTALFAFADTRRPFAGRPKAVLCTVICTVHTQTRSRFTRSLAWTLERSQTDAVSGPRSPSRAVSQFQKVGRMSTGRAYGMNDAAKTMPNQPPARRTGAQAQLRKSMIVAVQLGLGGGAGAWPSTYLPTYPPTHLPTFVPIYLTLYTATHLARS